MKDKLSNRYFKSGLMIFLSVCSCILFYYLLFHGSDVKSAIDKLFSIFTPIIFGVSLAYLLNPLMRFIENKVIKPIWDKIKNKNKPHLKEKIGNRAIAVAITMLLFVFALYGLIILIVPQVTSSIQNIIMRIPIYMNNVNQWFSELMENNPDVNDLMEEYWIDIENWFTSKLVPMLQDSISSVSGSLVGGVVGLFSTLLNFVVGIIISVYLLLSKEKFCAQVKKITYALLNEERANNLINNTRYTDKIFGGFITGKLLDSLIIGVLCYICMIIMKMPYPALISVIVGVTNVIPYFGPFIGAIPSALLIFMVNPNKCLTFVIFIFILQQFDGNVLGPKILGESTGLSSFWVIFAITVFSGFFGVFGMFIGVPVFAVIYATAKTFINQRLEKKKLPVSTDYYKEFDFHSMQSESINAGKEIRFVKKTFEKVIPEADSVEESHDTVNDKNTSSKEQ